MILSERTHQGTELIAFQLYRLYCLDITTGLVSSVSFFSSDLPHESTSLPLFTSISDDFFNSESTQRSHDSLIVTTSLIEKMNPFAEEDLRFSMDNQYRVDEEPLVEISHHESISERECMVNGMVTAQTKNYKKLMENEVAKRKSLEMIAEEMNQKFENKMVNFHVRENEMRKEVESRDGRIHNLYGEIMELRSVNKRLLTEKMQECDRSEKMRVELDLCRKGEMQKELGIYKEILESMDNKWNEFANKVQINHDTDPIHFIIKEKDDKIMELTMKIGSNITDIENELNRRNLSYKKENEAVYSVDNSKLVLSYENKQLLYRKVSQLAAFDDYRSTSPQKRSNSTARAEASFTKKSPKPSYNRPLDRK